MKTMTGDNKVKVKQPVTKPIISVVLGAGIILLVPLLAMQFTNEVAWTLFDFAVAGTLLVGTGLMYVLASRKVNTRQRRVAVGVALALALLFFWIELAVGIIGTPFAGS